jgi:predicted transcriptional regulator
MQTYNSIQERVQYALKDLPPKASLQTAATRLMYLAEIEEGLRSSIEEPLLTTEDALKEIESWYTSDGREEH